MPRWPLHERELLAEVRRRLHSQLAVAPPYPEVVGDRKILRFIRGFKHNVDQATEAYGKFLRWRKEFTPYPGGRVYDVDEIRHEIVSKNLDHPSKFPRGVRILEMIPHLAITPNARDKNGNLICVDQYKFKPGEVVSEIGLPDYLVFAVYCLEFRSLVVEQLSEKEERAFLDSLSPEQRARAVDPHGAIGGDNQPHGVILGTLVIRDMAGLTMEHCSEVGRQIIKAVVTVSSDNYPELLRRCLLINVPWIFNALWYFIKGMLHESTIRKIQLCGKDYHPLLLQDLQPEHVPVLVGGPYKGGMSPDDPESVLAWDLAFLVEGRTLDAEERLRGPAGGGSGTDGGGGGAGGGGGGAGGGGGGDSGAGGDGSEGGGASKGPGHQRRMTAMDRMHAQADAADGHSNASSNGANGSNKNSSASSNSSSSSSSNNNSLSLSLSASSIRSSLDKGASLAAAAARSALWKLEHHYLSRYPLWTAAVALYVCDFCLSGRLASVLPQLVPVLLVWAVLFVL